MYLQLGQRTNLSLIGSLSNEDSIDYSSNVWKVAKPITGAI
jgi:hypothetical protein